MYKKLTAVLIAGCMCLMCACTAPDDDTEPSQSGKIQPSIYQDENGHTVYNYDFEGGSKVSKKEEGELIKRQTTDAEFSAPKDGISREEAEALINSCSSYRLYLPGKTADFKKQYDGTTDRGGKSYYCFSFYAEKNNSKLYVGTDIIVACDGSAVYRLDASNTYQPVAIGGADEDKTSRQMYEGAKLPAKDALFSIIGISAEKTGLTQELSDYTFEADDELVTKKSIICYQFTPKLKYEGGVRLISPIYVAADASGRVLVLDNTEHEYVNVG